MVITNLGPSGPPVLNGTIEDPPCPVADPGFQIRGFIGSIRLGFLLANISIILPISIGMSRAKIYYTGTQIEGGLGPPGLR